MGTLLGMHATAESPPRVKYLKSLCARVFLHISNLMVPQKDSSLVPLFVTLGIRKRSTPVLHQAQGESQITKDKGRWALRKILCCGRAQHRPSDAQLMMLDGGDDGGYHFA